MKIFIKGLGSIGQRHIRNIKLLYPKSELFVLKSNKKRFLISKNFKRLKTTVEKKFKLNVLNSLNELNQIKIDCAFICSPTSKHLDDAKFFLEKGIYVFIEKPIDSDKKKVRIIKKLYLSNKRVMIGYQMKFNPLIIYIKKILTSKKYGSPYSAHIENHESIEKVHPYEDYRKSYTSRKDLGGGVVLGFIHEIDYFLYLFKEYNIVEKYFFTSKVSKLNINVEDILNAAFFLKHKKNSRKLICNISLNYFQTPRSRKIQIIFKDITLNADLLKNTITFENQKKELKKNFNFKSNDIFKKEVDYFLKCVKNKKPIDKSFSLNNGISTFEFSDNLKSHFV